MDSARPADNFVVLPGMRPTYTTERKPRLAKANGRSDSARVLAVSSLGEFVGTFLFLFFGFAGAQVANNVGGDPTSRLLYTSLAFGFSLAVNVWVFYRITGGLFNPAVTVGLALVGSIGWAKAALLVLSQIIAGIASAGVVSALFPDSLAVRTTLGPTTSIVRGLFIEMFLTSEVVFTVFMLAAEKHRATYLAPIGIGLAQFIAELAGVSFTGGSLNPARSFGPDVIHANFDGYHWIYWVGPLLGSGVAVVFYRLIKFLEYETANPGADSDGQPLGLHYADGLPTHRASRRVDGANDCDDFRPPLHTINTPFVDNQSNSALDRCNNEASALDNEHYGPAPIGPPRLPCPVHDHGLGLDGHRSDIYPPSRRSRSSPYSNSCDSEQNYRHGPSMRSATTTTASTSTETGSSH